MIIPVGVASALLGGVVVAAALARARAPYVGLADRIADAHERERDPDTDEAAELLRFQIAHGIVRCAPGCTDPTHETARSQARITREQAGRTEHGR